MEVTVISGDRDLLQLATEHVKIRIPKTKQGKTEIEDYYAKDVEERYQVTPKEFIDLKALMGDTADNIPGVPSIGEKTATKIITQYHSIEEAHEHVDELKPPRASRALSEHWDLAVLSKELATINVKADFPYDYPKQSSVIYIRKKHISFSRNWNLKIFFPDSMFRHRPTRSRTDLRSLLPNQKRRKSLYRRKKQVQ